MNTSNFIYLKKLYDSDDFVYVTDKRLFKKQYLSDCYTQYGQQIGHEDAGDYSIYNNYCTELIEECLKGLNETFGTQYSDVRDVWHNDEHQEWVEAFENEHCYYEQVLAYTYWDGSNWDSIIIKGDNIDTCISHEVIEGEDDLYDEILNNMKQVADEFGVVTYTCDKFDCTVEESRFAGSWEKYKIIFNSY